MRADSGSPPPAEPSATPRPSPNIWQHPRLYELENQALAADGALPAVVDELVAARPDPLILDLGCGTGFHLPRFAELARAVIGLEPHPPLVAAARQRVREAGLSNVAVVGGVAQQVPLADDSVDVAHARWAYFFGPGCEPGLAELGRVIRPGGRAVIIDHDASTSTFGQWFRREWPAYDPAAIERFWRRQGWSAQRVTVTWQLPSRAEFEAVVGIEFSPAIAAQLLAQCPGTQLDHALLIWYKEF